MSKKIYLDACVILAYLRNDPQRADIIESVLTQVRSKTLDATLFTSAISVIEVAHLSKPKDPVDSSLFPKIESFWRDSPITVVELNSIAARHGRDVIRARLLSHSGPEFPSVRKRKHDLGHIGTAIWLKADEIWSYDPEFSEYPINGIEVKQPHTAKPLLPGLTR